MNESIIQIVGDIYVKRGMFKKDAYRLIFVQERVLFSHLTKAIRKEERKTFEESLRGKSFKERMGAVFHDNQRVYEKYEKLTSEEILSAGTASFSLDYKDVLSIKKKVFFKTQDKEKPTKVTLKTINEELILSFSDETASNKTYKLIQENVQT